MRSRTGSLRARCIAVAVAGCVIGASGCSSTPSKAHGSSLSTSVSSTPSSPDAAEASSVATNAGSSPTTSTPPPQFAFGPGPFSLPDPTIGLDQLASYTATLTLSFDGTKAGQPLQFAHTYVLEVNRSLSSRLLTVQSGQATTTPEFHAEVNGAVYVTDTDGKCTAVLPHPIDATATTDGSVLAADPVLEPASLLSGFAGADINGSGSVNDSPSDHYTFDGRALGNLDPAIVTADAWVATTGGYLTRYTLTSTGPRSMLGNGADGTLTMEYELTAVNQPVNGILPAGCRAQINAPLLADATNIDRQPGYINYSTATLPTDALAFYQQQLPTLSWTPTADIPVVSGQGGQVSFTSASRRLTIAVSIDETGTTAVLIVQEPVAP